jgi:phosphoribosylformylglycinamidine synthase
MLIYQGKSPFSSFRYNKLLLHIQKQVPSLLEFSVNYLYFIALENISEQESQKLIKIIDPDATIWQEDILDSSIFVIPRFGTISPWSSKATDILHACGLIELSRIERGKLYQFKFSSRDVDFGAILPFIHDQMVETCCFQVASLNKIFAHHPPTLNEVIPFLEKGIAAINEANMRLGLMLSAKDVQYLNEKYTQIQKNPTAAELMMFAQVNSEHCRHKIFKAQWTINHEQQTKSLFDMICHTYQVNNEGVISAYKDNSAIINGHPTNHFFINGHEHFYSYDFQPAHMVIKVETHNHPTAIAPFEGAATGAGGEIRDEGATGTGAKPKAGLCGFSVSNLHIPKLEQPWETAIGYPKHIATSLDILLQGPIGAASFNNEFGRPTICGYFRTFEFNQFAKDTTVLIRGYHKPIMLAGGLGHISPKAVQKKPLPVGAKLIILGGPAMLIGLGGGAASSMYSGGSCTELDFASVQRSNPEMQRRCQEVINACWSQGDQNPILSIHDVGAGGLSNAFPELVHDSERGALFELLAIPTADTSLNAMQIWCNEAQERYVLAIHPANLALFEQIANRERCPYAIVGEVNDSKIIRLHDALQQNDPVDLPLEVLFGEASKLRKEIMISEDQRPSKALNISISLQACIEMVLQLPCVASKNFLVTIADRSVGGLIARDQMIGPWQVPVSDVGVTASGYQAYTGEAMAIGERTPVALLNARASARMAVAEAITNLIAADVQNLSDIKLSANWMAAANHPSEERYLYEAVQAIGMELCPALGICIPVGKDSLSMQMKWRENKVEFNVVSPLSLIISAFAPINDIRKTLTPYLETHEPTELLLIDLGGGKNRLGASALAQVTRQLGAIAPDLDDPALLINFFNAIKLLRDKQLILAYHDRSDGGALACFCEMAFASHTGLTIRLDALGDDPLSALFNEELGAIIQYRSANKAAVNQILEQTGLLDNSHPIGFPNDQDEIQLLNHDTIIYRQNRKQLQRIWFETSYHLQSLRDNPICALQEYDSLLNAEDPGLNARLSFEIPDMPPMIVGTRPKIAILREQGVNGHMEMAAAFDRAGFHAVDVHMTDLISDQIDLKHFQGLAVCGGFSYGDVFGAGRGWANSILYNEKAREQLVTFFNLPSSFVLGICNGCQMLSHLKELIPGASDWPLFVRNTSEQFEARLSLVKIMKSPSIFFSGMEESILPIIVSHGEGKAEFNTHDALQKVQQEQLIPLHYVDHFGHITETYPFNPNGSSFGIAAVTNKDGRFTIMMPHAERLFRTVQFSWYPREWQKENSPWFQLFVNARKWLKNA